MIRGREFNDMSIADLRRLIVSIVGVRGHMPPDWVTVKRWRERLMKDDRYCDQGLRELLELKYGEDFGAYRKLVSLSYVKKQTGLSYYKVHRIAQGNGILVTFCGRYCIERGDYERVFQGGGTEEREGEEDGGETS